MILALDAYSVFAAVTANTVKVPADSSLFAHIQYLRELIGHLFCTPLQETTTTRTSHNERSTKQSHVQSGCKVVTPDA